MKRTRFKIKKVLSYKMSAFIILFHSAPKHFFFGGGAFSFLIVYAYAYLVHVALFLALAVLFLALAVLFLVHAVLFLVHAVLFLVHAVLFLVHAVLFSDNAVPISSIAVLLQLHVLLQVHGALVLLHSNYPGPHLLLVVVLPLLPGNLQFHPLPVVRVTDPIFVGQPNT